MNHRHVYRCIGGPLARQNFAFPVAVHDCHGFVAFPVPVSRTEPVDVTKINPADFEPQTLPQYRVIESYCEGDMIQQVATYFCIPDECPPHREAYFLARELCRYQDLLEHLNKSDLCAPGYVSHAAERHGIRIIPVSYPWPEPSRSK